MIKFNNTLHTEVYDKDGKLIKKFTDKNLVVTQGKEVLRDCLIYVNKTTSEIGLRNIKLSTDTAAISPSSTTLGGTEYDAGLQSNDSELNLETEMYFETDTLEHDTLNIPFKWTNDTGSSVDLNKIGLYDYNGGTERLFSALMLFGGLGTTVPAGGFILNKYEVKIQKAGQSEGYLTDWGIKAIIHALVYGNTDYNIDYVGFGSGENLIPAMTSDSSPAGLIFYTSSYGNNRVAFNSELTGASTVWDANGYVGYVYESTVTISHFKIRVDKLSTGTDYAYIETSTDTTDGHDGAWNTASDIITLPSVMTEQIVFLVAYKTFKAMRIKGADFNGNVNFYKIESMSYQDSNSINGLFATTQATSILPSESNKLLTSFDYTDSGGHQVEEVGVMSMKDDFTTDEQYVDNINSLANMHDGDIATYGDFSSNNGYVNKYNNNSVPIGLVVLKIRSSSNTRDFKVEVCDNASGSSSGSWETVYENSAVPITMITVNIDCTNYSAIRISSATSSTNSSYRIRVYEFTIFNEVDLFSKFAHSKTLSDTEQWVDTITEIVGTA